MVADLLALARSTALARARFDARSYQRELLDRGNGYELYLLAWLPGQATSIHDHGGAVTACEIVRGKVREEQFAVRGSRAVLIGEEIRVPGSIDTHPGDVVHRVTALEPTVSLLVYLPGAGEYSTYESEAAA
jgi:cysteine dioxygenase